MKYPLAYTYTNVVETKHWSALVVVRGRCLMQHEDGEWWIEAVEPGGFAAHDEQPAFAMKNFRETWNQIVEDVREGKQSFDEFRQELESIARQVSRPANAEWFEARTRIHAAKLAEPFASMPRITGEFDSALTVYGGDKPEAASHPDAAIPVEQVALIEDKQAA